MNEDGWCDKMLELVGPAGELGLLLVKWLKFFSLHHPIVNSNLHHHNIIICSFEQ